MKKSTIKSFLLLALLLMGAGSSWAATTAPTVTLTKVYNTTRTYTITFTEGLTLYYELPGETNFTAVTSGTSKVVETSTSGTLSAYTSDGTTPSSTVTTTVDASNITLAAPSIKVSSSTASGSFYKLSYDVTSDQSKITLKPSASIAAVFKNSSNVESTVSLPYTPTETGILTVTASCDGYTSNSTSATVYPLFEKVIMEDYTSTSYDVSDATKWTKQTTASTYWGSVDVSGTSVYQVCADGTTINEIKYPYKSFFELGLGIGLKNIRLKNSSNYAAQVYVLYSGIVSFEYADKNNANLSENFVFGNTNSTQDYVPALYILHKINKYVPMDASAITIKATKNFATYTPTANAVAFLDGDDQPIKAYKALYTSGNAITMERVYTAAVGQGVLLCRTNQTENSANISCNAYSVTATTVTTPSDNVLVGVTTPLTAQQMIDAQKTNSKTPYVLNDGIWYQVDATASNSLPAGKAYLAINKVDAANAIQMNFGDVATGINEVSAVRTGDNKIYNLQGMEVKNTEKGGLYIVNGKKVVF